MQLIDGTQWFTKLRKNLGQKNCELGPDDIERIVRTFLDFGEHAQSKIFPNAAFGYWKITVERPLQLRFCLDVTAAQVDAAAAKAGLSGFTAKATSVLAALRGRFGVEVHLDANPLFPALEEAIRAEDTRWSAKEKKTLLDLVTARDEAAAPVVKKRTKLKPGDSHLQSDCALYGQYPVEEGGKTWLVEYEADSDLRDTEQVPLLEEGGVAAFLRREVLPHVPDAWIDAGKTVIGYEISFNRYFYKPQPLRTLAEIRADILALEQETEGLLSEIIGI